MDMCYNGALVMPNNYAVMDEDEKMYLEGGWDYTYSPTNIRVPMKAMYLSRMVCISFASYVIGAHGTPWYGNMVNGMDRVRVAQELFAHAVGYYASSALYGIGLKASVIKDIRECGSVADIGLGDGLDLAYAIIWSCGVI